MSYLANHFTSSKNKIWVVFSGQTDRPWLRFLRRGFRHCFVVMHDGSRWVSFDPMLNHIELKIHDHVPSDFDLPKWLQKRGHMIVEAEADHGKHKPAPIALFTCVEAVKRFLGVHKMSVMTPWQLYRYLNHSKNARTVA